MVPAEAPELVVCATAEALAERAANLFRRTAQESVGDHGCFRVALAGGATPRAMYARLAENAVGQFVPWQRTEIFWGDERVVPPDDPASNYRMAREALLAHVPIPADHVHRFRTELVPADAIARQYEDELRTSFSLAAGSWPRFDLILLGMGPDGHTASLFPGSPALCEQERFAVAVFAGHLGVYRVTLTLPVLNAAHCVLFLVQGGTKAEMLRQVLQEGQQPVPAQHVRPHGGRLIWMVDTAAAGLLNRVTRSRTVDG